MILLTQTFSFMAWKGIGMNINTLRWRPLGIGLGVDYAFYIIDDIREELRHGKSLERPSPWPWPVPAKGVTVTAGTLILAVAVIREFLVLRFQSEMAC